MNFKKSILCLLVIACCLLRCNSKNEKRQASDAETVLDVRAAEIDYLKKRDEYITTLQRRIAKADNDSLSKAEEFGLSDLEGRLKSILKNSHFSGKGQITIETFTSGIGVDLLDGLVFKKDSTTRIFYTTKYLCAEYFKEKERKDSSRNLSASHFENVFSYAFQSDARVNNYSFFKIDSPDSIEVYGMIAQLGQGESTRPPQYLYVFASTADFIYMAEIDLKTPIRGIRKCEVIMDSLESPENYQNARQSLTQIDSSSVRKDSDPYHRYYKCYSDELKHDPQFPGIRKQMQSIAGYLINPGTY